MTVTNIALDPRVLRRKVEVLTAKLRHYPSTRLLREAIRGKGLDLSRAVLAGATGEGLESGLLVTRSGELFEFECAPGTTTFARWHQHDAPNDVLAARYPALGIALEDAPAGRHYLITTQQHEVLLDSVDLLQPTLAQGIAILADEDARALRDLATRTFTDGTVRTLSVNALVGYAQVTCEDSWRLVEDFAAAGPVVMFTNRDDGEAMFELPSVRDAVAVRGAMPRFDFYLVDRPCTYLFAADEYDTLFGCGAAAPYVARL